MKIFPLKYGPKKFWAKQNRTIWTKPGKTEAEYTESVAHQLLGAGSSITSVHSACGPFLLCLVQSTALVAWLEFLCPNFSN